MPRPPRLNWEQHRPQITSLYQSGATSQAITSYLLDETGVSMTPTHLRRLLQSWGVPRQRPRTEVTPDLKERIEALFFQHALTDAEIVKALEQEGTKISSRKVQEIRWEIGLYRRHNAEQLATAMAEVREFFEGERTTTNIVRHMGYRSLYVHMRQRFFNIPRDSLRAVYAEFHEDAIAHRRARAERKRSGWTVPGPNYIWSVDGYCKLEYFGIEIYAGIDAYSRYITWFYIGVSA
ncbi:hypothetical protein N657DRAFT_628661 [Parathielavia appendiculata]|uniref:Clr5 domain-containing protein n=1 Tax=Parathielavia appendiculata TaxID=2587402 RepID=A0AAN6TPK4_9PEZI|nr:hypothetical protein N657DRAFT_628661 [Parathielavia appendiculata]